MNKNISACKNYSCEGYKNNTCRRALRHRLALVDKEQFVSYVNRYGNETHCDLWLPVDDKIQK